MLAFVATSVPASDPAPDFGDALWVGHPGGINKIDEDSGALSRQVTQPPNVQALSVDDRAGAIWAFGEGKLVSFDFKGQQKQSIPVQSPAVTGTLPPLKDLALHQPLVDSYCPLAGTLPLSSVSPELLWSAAKLSASPEDGSVWLGLGDQLYQYSPEGFALSRITTPGLITGVTVDRARMRVWVSTCQEVLAYEPDGSLYLRKLIVPDPAAVTLRPWLHDLDYDQSRDELWLVHGSNLQRYTVEGVKVLDKQLVGVAFDHVGADGKGSAWASQGNGIFHFDAAGNQKKLQYINTDTIAGAVAGFAVNQSDQSIWVSQKTQLVHILPDSPELRRISAPIQLSALDIYTDLIAPVVTITAPAYDAYTNLQRPALGFSYSDIGRGVKDSSLAILANDAPIAVNCVYGNDSADCTPVAAFGEGVVTLKVTVEDFAGNVSSPVSRSFTVDVTPPTIHVDSPADNSYTNATEVTIAGSVSEPAQLTINSISIPVATSGAFTYQNNLVEGVNSFTLSATDRAGNAAQQALSITRDTQTPDPDASLIRVTDAGNGKINVSGATGSVEPGSSVTITNRRTGESVTVTANADGSFNVQIAARIGDELAITAQDKLGNTSNERLLNYVPPDPATVAPPLAENAVTPFASAVEFLYTGTNPIQTGVAPGTISPDRVAVLRGQVQQRDGSPLPGVTITVLGHPEFGQTFSRANGVFDIAVNGGGLLTVDYQKLGYLPVQRQVKPDWKSYAWADDVVMIPLDAQLTVVNLADQSQPFQVAKGSPVNDSSGTRQAAILFPAGTTATMVLPNGEQQPLTQLNVRATEYTVGPKGLEAMPGALPPTSAYTYAVELSVDQATTADATRVNFSQPLPFYVDNFLNFPAGEVVPAGYYDRKTGVWRAGDNGRVIKILSIQSGRAVLDVTGSGQPADQAALDSLGIAAAELEQLAVLYPAGKSLWRTPISHFTPWDCNWPYVPPQDATSPDVPNPTTLDEDQPDKSDEETPCSGCIISPQRQTLGERVPVAGTSFDLVYSSDRTSGYTNAAARIDITSANVPASLRNIGLNISIAGQQISRAFGSQPNQYFDFLWDGRDGYGRQVYGRQVAIISLTYFYPCVYVGAGPASARAWAEAAESFRPIGTRQDCRSMTMSRQWSMAIESPHKIKANSVGAWGPGVHHAFDSIYGVLHLGSGELHTLPTATINTFAGNGQWGFGGDGGPATSARLSDAFGVSVDAAGNVYIADSSNSRIRKVTSDGVIRTVAGTGIAGYSGDGGPATSARLRYPRGIAVDAAGNLYIADTDNHRVRKVTPNGVITTIAGTGAEGFSGDGGPAASAQLLSPADVTIHADGSIFIAGGNRVRKISLDGIITTVAGIGLAEYSAGDGGPATAARLSAVAIAIDTAGNLLIADGPGGRIRRVSPDGIITTVAGGGSLAAGDGVPAVAAGLKWPSGVAVDSVGNIYIADHGDARLRKVSSDGVITTVAGTGEWGYNGDGGPATAAWLYYLHRVALDVEGRIYITNRDRVRRVDGDRLSIKTRADGTILVPSPDGAWLYTFDMTGRHLRTSDPVTDATIYTFGYDGLNHLISIADAYGKITAIERDSSGSAMAIVAPDGQRTALTTNEMGHLTTIGSPDGRNWSMAYTPDGLLTRFESPKGHATTYAYDGSGRLLRDEAPNGDGWQISRTELQDGYRTDMVDGEGRVSRFTTERDAIGRRIYHDQAPDGTVTQRRYTDAETAVTQPDGTVTVSTHGPDPRFGMQAPLTSTEVVGLPSGLNMQRAHQRAVTLAIPTDPLSLSSLTDTFAVNGRQSTRVFNAASRRWTATSAGARITTHDVDAQGRLVATQVPGLARGTYAYDGRGRLTGTTEDVEGNARTWNFAYHDAEAGAQAGYLASITDPLQRTTLFEYDAAGRITAQILPGDRRTEYTYDPNGNLTALKPPGRDLHVFEYDAVDEVSDYTPPELPEGSTITRYRYNLDKQLTSVQRPDGETFTFNYDSGGRLQSVMTPPGAVTYAYQATTGQLASISSPGGTLSYSYDGFLPLSETVAGAFSGTVVRSYDNNFWVRSLSVNDQSIAYDYDADGLLTRAGDLTLTPDAQNGLLRATTLGNVTTALDYNAFGELARQAAKYSADDLYSVDYVRDKLGRITQKTEAIGGSAASTSYQYDAAGHLIEVSTSGGSSVTYAYDANGNRSSANGINATYDAQDRLLTYAGASYSYTENGELKTRTESGVTTRYDYDVLGNLWRVELPGDVAIDYIIDGRNRRIGKKVNGTLVQGFLYQGQLKPVAELDGSGNVVARFVYADKGNVPSYVIKNGQTYRIISDHLGSPRLVVNSGTGEMVQLMDYDAFGNVTQDTNPGFQPFGFAGGIQDPHTGLIRFGARDYDPQTGRWTAKDPILFDGGDSNLYGYVLSDPINLIDPEGLRGGAPAYLPPPGMRPPPQGRRDQINQNSPLRPIATGARQAANARARENELAREFLDKTLQEFPGPDELWLPMAEDYRRLLDQAGAFSPKMCDRKATETRQEMRPVGIF